MPNSFQNEEQDGLVVTNFIHIVNSMLTFRSLSLQSMKTKRLLILKLMSKLPHCKQSFFFISNFN